MKHVGGRQHSNPARRLGDSRYYLGNGEQGLSDFAARWRSAFAAFLVAEIIR